MNLVWGDECYDDFEGNCICSDDTDMGENQNGTVFCICSDGSYEGYTSEELCPNVCDGSVENWYPAVFNIPEEECQSICIEGGGTVYDWNDSCGTCCFSTNECWQPYYDPEREGCMDICEQENDGGACNALPALIHGEGSYCNNELSLEMPWFSSGETCGLYTEEACCVNGWRQDATTGYEWEQSTLYSCNSDSNINDGLPINYPVDCSMGGECEEAYTTGLEEGILIGAESGDVNGDGVLNIMDMVIYIEKILNP